jgi:hypothetical protein
MADKLKYTLQEFTMFVVSVVTSREGCKSWLMPKPFTPFWPLFWLILLLGVSCQKEEVKPTIEKVTDYFPLRYGNQWTYTIEGIDEDGHISSTDTEKWKVNSDLFIDLYRVTPVGEDYLGYQAMYLQDDLEINDIIGTFISVKFLNLSADSLVLVASDNLDVLRERWIKGGLTKLKTSFGELECICTKTTIHFPGDRQDVYLYFCKNIGIYLQEQNYIYEDQAGNSQVGFTWRRTLTDYQIN